MKLNNEKNIVLCEKALYVKQLEYYAKMCNIYAKLAQKSGPISNPELMEQKYATALSLAAHGDMDTIKRSRLSSDDKELLFNYSVYAGKLESFKVASEVLADSLTYSKSHRTARIDQTYVQEFRDCMQNDKSTKAFLDKFDVATPLLVGHESFVRAKTARQSILDIDPNHIPQTFNKTFTPSAFGAEISGFRVPVQEVIKDSRNIFDSQEIHDYKRKPNSFTEGSKVLANSFALKVGQTFKGNKKLVRTAISAALLSAAILGSVNHFQDVNRFNDLNVRTNVEQGYDIHVENDTMKELSDIRKLIEDYKTSGVMPDFDQMYDIRDRLDSSITSVVSDLVIDAYKEAHPDYTNIQVENKYDKTVNQNIGSGDPNPENFILVTYTDKKGEQHNDSITNLGSVALTNNPLQESFENEYDLDKSIKQSIINLYDSTSTATFKEKSDKADELLDTYLKVIEQTEHLAGTKVVLNDLLSPLLQKSVSTELPAQNEKDSDDAR